jgi:ATP-dependent exoDNAse (exonuclease V) beta subunit
LDVEAEMVGAEEAPLAEEGTEGVRLMTVHKAKGLEFPVVILADPLAPHIHRRPSRWVDSARGLWAETLCGSAPAELTENAELELRRDAAEADRVAYVAATRARDLLVIPVFGDEETSSGWLQALHPVVYPPAATRRSPRPAEGCPEFDTDSVLQRRGDAPGGPHSSVAPGLHVSRAGTEVVWWSPGTLKLEKRSAPGVGQEDVLTADESGVAVRRGTEAHDRWAAQRAETLRRSAVPSLRTAPIGRLALDGDSVRVLIADGSPPRGGDEPASGDPQTVLVERVQVDRAERPHGTRFGRLVHLVLATAPLDSGGDVIAQVARAHGRALGATAEEVESAALAASAALGHPAVSGAVRSTDVRREVPVFVPVLGHSEGDGAEASVTLGEGVIDLAYKSEGGWVVVDFKTDMEIAASEDAYRRQVALYAAGVCAATGEPATAILLVV